MIHHSDRDSQYASTTFKKLIDLHGVKGSISLKGDCWGNAVVKNFFGSLKQKLVDWKNYQIRSEAQQDILNYISVFYYNYRLHSTLGYMSPVNYEKQLVETKEAA